MNQKFFGATITKLRKRNRMTQAALAKSLNVSDKAISKWETGLGYPEITLLPRIAAVFGVTIDYLITGELPLPVTLSLTITKSWTAVRTRVG